MMYCGIDPGLKGSLVFKEDKEVWCYATPLTTYNKKSMIDPQGVMKLLLAHNPDIIIIENVHSMPNQGVASMFTFGFGFGILLSAAMNYGLIIDKSVEVYRVPPPTWKKFIRLPGKAKKEEILNIINEPALNNIKGKELKVSCAEGLAMIKWSEYYERSINGASQIS